MGAHHPPSLDVLYVYVYIPYCRGLGIYHIIVEKEFNKKFTPNENKNIERGLSPLEPSARHRQRSSVFRSEISRRDEIRRIYFSFALPRNILESVEENDVLRTVVCWV